MYTLHLDLHMSFVPPMSGHRGVVLTRELKLPFAPVEDLIIFSKAIDDCPEPEGLCLKGVIWDLDREVFLAHTEYAQAGFPMDEIVEMLRGWVDLGWRWGSYRDFYKAPDDKEPSEIAAKDASSEKKKARRPKWPRRDAKVNRIYRALIRHMAEHYDNQSGAYAFDVTGRFFEEFEIEKRKPQDKEIEAFAKARRHFLNMSDAAQWRWVDGLAGYPTLRELVESREEARRGEPKPGPGS